MEELVDIGLLLDRQPAPRGLRLALVGNAGGPLVLGADAADDAGAAVPELSAELRRRLAGIAPAATSWANPFDAGPSASPDDLANLVRTIAASGEVDACVVVCVELDESHVDETLALLDAVDVDDVPIAVTAIGGRPRAVGRLPMFPTPERAATAMALACGRAAWLSREAALKGRRHRDRRRTVDRGAATIPATRRRRGHDDLVGAGRRIRVARHGGRERGVVALRPVGRGVCPQCPPAVRQVCRQGRHRRRRPQDRGGSGAPRDRRSRRGSRRVSRVRAALW